MGIRSPITAIRQRVSGLLGSAQDRWERSQEQQPPKGTIAINLRPIRSSWGGGNQWAKQMTHYLREQGYAVRFDLEGPVDVVLLADPRLSYTASFGLEAIGRYKREHPKTIVVHRINENDQRKGTAFIDDLLRQANTLADYTVFVSSWLRDYHAQRWFDTQKPHRVILNGADPAVFHSSRSVAWDGKETLRLATHHWSDNPMKGFAVYARLDQAIKEKKVLGAKLVIIGRYPAFIQWQTAELHAPESGAKLANLLGSCHAYITASLWDPGPMHIIEAAQCGLPVLYHEDGGGIVEMAQPYGIAFSDDPAAALEQLRLSYTELRSKVIANAPSGARMAVSYLEAIVTAKALRKN